MIRFKTEKPILCIGDANPDIILPYAQTLSVNKKIADGETFTEQQRGAEMIAGGSVANTANGIAKLGLDSMFCGKAGDDAFGKFLKADFEKENVNTDYFYLSQGEMTTMVLAVIGEDKDRILYEFPRKGAAYYQLNKNDLSDEIISKIGWVHTSGIILWENPAAAAVVDFLKRCKKSGVIVSFDLNLRIESVGLNEDLLNNVNGAIEASHIIFGSGTDEFIPLSGKSNIEEAAKSFITKDRAVVCRNGKYGSTVYTFDNDSFAPAFDVEVLDTIGAGDSFDAGFIVAASLGKPLSEANLWGNASAGYNIMHQGGRNTPTQEQLSKFLEEYKDKIIKI